MNPSFHTRQQVLLDRPALRWLLVFPALLLASVALLAACYAPAFAVAQLLAHRTALAMGAVVVVSACMALGCIAVAQWLKLGGPVSFGFCSAGWSDLALWTVLSLVVGSLLHGLGLMGRETMPAAVATQPLWVLLIVVVIGASVQEELIFRGLLLTAGKAIARRLRLQAIGAEIAAVCSCALLFGAMHLPIGPRTAAAATVLGALAGAARVYSGSLWPAVTCHAALNAMALGIHVAGR